VNLAARGGAGAGAGAGASDFRGGGAGGGDAARAGDGAADSHGGGAGGGSHGRDGRASPARPVDLLLRSPGHFLALGFGAGLAPVAPGTAGSLAALPFLFGFAQLGAWACVAAVALGFAVGIAACARAARALGKTDHPAIVWDEVVGLWAALCFIPLSPAAILAGFLLFRALDIAKPWPIRRLERAPGGLGIMLDDLAAGLLANLALRVLLPYLP